MRTWITIWGDEQGRIEWETTKTQGSRLKKTIMLSASVRLYMVLV